MDLNSISNSEEEFQDSLPPTTVSTNTTEQSTSTYVVNESENEDSSDSDDTDIETDTEESVTATERSSQMLQSPENDVWKGLDLLQSTDSQNSRPCDSCNDKARPPNTPIVGICIECGYMCSFCLQCHKNMIYLKTHLIIDFNEPTETHCAQHSTKKMARYCYDCSQTFCYVCGKHHEHDTIPITIAAEFEKKRITAVVAEAVQKKAELEKLRFTAVKRLEQKEQESLQSINQACCIVMNVIKEHETNVISKLNAYFFQKRKQFNVIASEEMEILKEIKMHVQLGYFIVSHGTASDVIHRITNTIPELKEYNIRIQRENLIENFFEVMYKPVRMSNEAIEKTIRNLFDKIGLSNYSQKFVVREFSQNISYLSENTNTTNYLYNKNPQNVNPMLLPIDNTISSMLPLPDLSVSLPVSPTPGTHGPLEHLPLSPVSILPTLITESTISSSSISVAVSPNLIYSSSSSSNTSSLPLLSDEEEDPQNEAVNPDPPATLSSDRRVPFIASSNAIMASSLVKRSRMNFCAKFGSRGTKDGQFTEPNGITTTAEGDIVIADTNSHRIQIFDSAGKFKFQFGEQGKLEGQLLYPNRIAVSPLTGDFVITERSPTHQIQVYDRQGNFVRRFGFEVLEHPRGVCVDNEGRVIIVECKLMRVCIFSSTGILIHKFVALKALHFPTSIAVGFNEELLICDNRDHCIKIFNYDGEFLRSVGGEGITNYPIGVFTNTDGEILVVDNHNNINVTVLNQDGKVLRAFECKVRHAHCYNVAIRNNIVYVASKDFKVYFYTF